MSDAARTCGKMQFLARRFQITGDLSPSVSACEAGGDEKGEEGEWGEGVRGEEGETRREEEEALDDDDDEEEDDDEENETKGEGRPCGCEEDDDSEEGEDEEDEKEEDEDEDEEELILETGPLSRSALKLLLRPLLLLWSELLLPLLLLLLSCFLNTNSGLLNPSSLRACSCIYSKSFNPSLSSTEGKSSGLILMRETFCSIT